MRSIVCYKDRKGVVTGFGGCDCTVLTKDGIYHVGVKAEDVEVIGKDTNDKLYLRWRGSAPSGKYVCG